MGERERKIDYTSENGWLKNWFSFREEKDCLKKSERWRKSIGERENGDMLENRLWQKRKNGLWKKKKTVEEVGRLMKVGEEQEV